MRQEINGWRKHLDFIALDVICLHLAYALAYCLRFGWGDPYARHRGSVVVALTVSGACVQYSVRNVIYPYGSPPFDGSEENLTRFWYDR